MAYNWISLGIVVFVFILSALPLHRAVRIVKGKTRFPKTLAVMVVAGLIVGVIGTLFEIWGGLLAFVVLIWIYHTTFRLPWYKAILVWALHLVFVVVSSLVIDLLLRVFTGLSFLLS